MNVFCSSLLIIFLALATALQSAHANQQRFTVDGTTLVYDSSIEEGDTIEDIDWDDIARLESALKSHPNIKLLVLNSTGGSIFAAFYFADIVIDYELDTNVDGTCESACTIIFLAGEKRSVERGSWIGFHQSYWNPEYIAEYYEKEKESMGWTDTYEFASWLYEDTQDEVLKKLQYLTERGVEPLFAIKTMRATSDDMWYPRRKELEAAGVIRN